MIHRTGWARRFLSSWPFALGAGLAFLIAGLVVLVGGAFLVAGCPHPVPMSGRSEPWFQAPDGERSATVSRDRSRYRVVVRPDSDWDGGRHLRERPDLWTSNGVVPRYVFWIDDRTLEILVLEADRADFGSIRTRSVSGVQVVTRAIPTTDMRTVLRSELLPELTVGSMDGPP